MVNETLTTIVGNVISDLTPRRTSSGVRVVGFRMASNERRFDKATEQWVDGDRLYVSVTCWRKLAKGVAGSLTKGDPVIVTGRLYTREFEMQGQRRSVTELEATAVGPDLARCTADVERVRREAVSDVGAQAEARLVEPRAAEPPAEPPTESVVEPNSEHSEQSPERALQVVPVAPTG